MRLRELETEALNISSGHTNEMSALSQPTSSHKHGFDVSKNTFRESEVVVRGYFCAFERVEGALSWPKDTWPTLLLCEVVGKAQEVVSSLTAGQLAGGHFTCLVPEAYRQKFRHYKKGDGQTFAEFARKKTILSIATNTRGC